MKFWTKNDIIFTVVISILIIALLVFYFIDINKTYDYKGSRVGVIQFMVPVASRNHNTVLVWDRLKNNSPLYANDTIRTESFSEAKIIFSNNMELNLSGNTMIKLPTNIDNDIRNFGDLASSDITVSTQKEEREILVAGKKVQLDRNTMVILRSDKVNKNITECEVIEGKVKVLDKKNDITVKKHQTLIFDAEKETVGILEDNFLLLEPAHNSHTIVNNDVSEINFLWSTTTSQPSLVEISKDRHFKKILYSVEPTEIQKNTDFINCAAIIKIEPGTFFWRIKTSDNSVSKYRKFRIEKTDVVELINPENDERFDFIKKAPKINFVWSKDKSASGYKIEISQSQEFNKIIFERETAMNSIIIDKLNVVGDYFWRVIPIYPDYAKLKQKLNEVVVGRFKLSNIDFDTPPKLISPSPNFVCNVDGFASSGVNLSWQNIQDADSYEISIYESEDSTVPAEVITSKFSFIKLNDLNSSSISDLDSYYWSVAWVDSENKKSAESERRYVKNIEGNQFITSLFPTNKYLLEQSISSEMVFTWKFNTEGRCVFYLARDDKLEDIVMQSEVNTTNLNCPYLALGKYYWAIKSYDNNGTVIQNSEIREFEVVPPHEPLPLLFPEADGFVNILNGTSTSVEVSWAKEKNADYYDLEIYDENGNMKVKNSFYESTKFKLPISDTKSTDYTIVVQALTNDSMKSSRIIGKKSFYKFTVRVLNSIELISPEDNSQMHESKVFNNNPILSWKSDISLGSPKVEIFRNNSIVSARDFILRDDSSVQLVNPQPGNYKWTVKAIQYGIDVSANEYYRFQIAPKLPLLPKPVYIKEETMNLYNTASLLEKKQIGCAWESVSESQYYKVRLFKKGKNKPIISTETTETSFIISDLSILSAGDFYWDVVAESEVFIEDDKFIRNGKHSIFNFKIDIPVLEKIVPDSQGTYYGY